MPGNEAEIESNVAFVSRKEAVWARFNLTFPWE